MENEVLSPVGRCYDRGVFRVGRDACRLGSIPDEVCFWMKLVQYLACGQCEALRLQGWDHRIWVR